MSLIFQASCIAPSLIYILTLWSWYFSHLILLHLWSTYLHREADISAILYCSIFDLHTHIVKLIFQPSCIAPSLSNKQLCSCEARQYHQKQKKILELSRNTPAPLVTSHICKIHFLLLVNWTTSCWKINSVIENSWLSGKNVLDTSASAKLLSLAVGYR